MPSKTCGRQAYNRAHENRVECIWTEYIYIYIYLLAHHYDHHHRHAFMIFNMRKMAVAHLPRPRRRRIGFEDWGRKNLLRNPSLSVTHKQNQQQQQMMHRAYVLWLDLLDCGYKRWERKKKQNMIWEQNILLSIKLYKLCVWAGLLSRIYALKNGGHWSFFIYFGVLQSPDESTLHICGSLLDRKKSHSFLTPQFCTDWMEYSLIL